MTPKKMADALQAYTEWCGGVHDDLCPEDDTCECSVKWVNDGVNAAVNYLRGVDGGALPASPAYGQLAERVRELSEQVRRYENAQCINCAKHLDEAALPAQAPRGETCQCGASWVANQHLPCPVCGVVP